MHADAGERLQLAFVVANEADHKMGQPGVGVSHEPVRNGGARTGEPPLVLLHHLAAAGIGVPSAMERIWSLERVAAHARRDRTGFGTPALCTAR